MLTKQQNQKKIYLPQLKYAVHKYDDGFNNILQFFQQSLLF